jgi:hypothetical protein
MSSHAAAGAGANKAAADASEAAEGQGRRPAGDGGKQAFPAGDDADEKTETVRRQRRATWARKDPPVDKAGRNAGEAAPAWEPRKGDKVVYRELNARKWRAAIVINTARNGLAAGIYCCYYDGRVCEHPDVMVTLLRKPNDKEEQDLAHHWAQIEDYAASSRSVLLLVLRGRLDGVGRIVVEDGLRRMCGVNGTVQRRHVTPTLRAHTAGCCGAPGLTMVSF